MQGGEPDIQTLQPVYDRLVRERDRLRDARRGVTAQLGLLPAAAAVVLGLFAGLPDEIHNRGLVGTALALFVVVILLSGWGIRLNPYRRLSGRLDAPTGRDGLRDDDFLPRRDWLLERIKLARTGRRRRPTLQTGAAHEGVTAEQAGRLNPLPPATTRSSARRTSR